MFAVSALLSKTVLKGEVSTFSLELPPYRPPRVLQTLYTSLIDRTAIVLWRAIIYAAPAGAVIWLTANINIAGLSIAEHMITWMNPFGLALGMNGVIFGRLHFRYPRKRNCDPYNSNAHGSSDR